MPRFRSTLFRALTLLIASQTFVTAATRVPGPRPDGSVLLPNQWSLRPVGQQVVLGDFPVNVAVHPARRFAAVLHAGHGQHEVVVVDLQAARVHSRSSLPETFYGIQFSTDGSQLFCSGAGDEVVHVFAFNSSDGHLGQPRQIRVRDPKERGIPSGLALSENPPTLYAANLWAHRVSRIELSAAGAADRVVDIPLDGSSMALATDREKPPADEDAAAAVRRFAALNETITSEHSFPYACCFDAKRQRLYVSLWAQASVAVIDLHSNQIVARWRAEEHPNEMILSKSGNHLFVANANRNTVTLFDTDTGQAIETLSAALYPATPPGSTPNSLALTPDEKLLFVANADNNNVAVFDVAVPGKSHSLGFIPVGWYPTAVRVTPDGKQLLVANGKGVSPKANRHGPQPGRSMPPTLTEYIGSLYRGTLSIIELPEHSEFEKRLAKYTAQAYQCSPLQRNAEVGVHRPDRNPIPLRPGDSSPIRYCIYVIKENRTYDQVFGDMPEGNGDPTLCLFPEHVTPNHHKLAREFVLLDNFYVESEVSADGHEWTMGAYASDFVEKTWPLSYGHNKHGKYPYPSEGRFQVSMPSGGYLWDRAREAGVTYRSYGEFTSIGKNPGDPATTRVAALQNNFDPHFRPWDMDYSDVLRAERFISELRRFEREGDMPRLQIVRLPNDHTYGTTAGKLTPTAMMAQNDLALGMFVEAVSRSKFWSRTAIFVVEDDAQNGPDHVDAHRTIAFVISPYVKRRSVDSTMYSTSSMLRTMELILGLKPMSQFDAAATPMYSSFQPRRNLRPYRTEPANVDIHERNTQTAWGSELSRQMDFSKEDAADDLLLNEVVWRSIRGPDHPMPAPIRAAFVFVHDEEEEEEEREKR